MRIRLVGLGIVCALAATLMAGAGTLRSSSTAAPDCPAGYKLLAKEEAAMRQAGVVEQESLHKEVLAASTCVTTKHPESLLELEIRGRQLNAVRAAPHGKVHPGAFSGALEERAAMPKSVNGSEGAWRPYGHGPLISDDPAYNSVNGLGLVDLQGRIDSLYYDEASKRLFAAKGTGGIWTSTDYGDTWRSIGDNLPSQIVGAVAWTPAHKGTVLAVSGDPTFGGGGYTGYGAFYSNNLGKTWRKATGIPDGALGFEIEVDPTNPTEVYAATLFGLYRSTDGGRSYANVNLPTGECSGIAGGGRCQLANVVTDIAIKGTGGVNADVPAGTVLAAVAWRGGRRKNSDGSVQSEHNGLYRSTTGAPNTFVRLSTPGFTPQERIGRVEFGQTTGANQDKDYLYAIVQDAVVLNGGVDVIDAPESFPNSPIPGGTVLNGIYVSKDFGATWTLMADDNAIAKNPATGSALVGVGQALGFEPGIQAWYNEWIAPDPTRQSATGVPTRLAFGLEEVWQNELPLPMDGPATFKVIGRYFSGDSCMLLETGLPECPTDRPPSMSTTTHPDQHDAVWIPDSLGGVTLAVGNDGGFYKNHVAPGHELDNGGWGDGNQTGFNTLLPYDVAMANDGTAYAGLQDNGHMKITPDGQQYMVYGGDGTFAETDPANSDIVYEAYTFNDMSVSTDGGKSWRGIDPGLTNTRFINPFEMDPTNARHLVTAGNEVAETWKGPDTEAGHSGGNSWSIVYDLGTAQRPGDAAATPSSTDPANGMSAIDVHGETIYVGYCGVCDVLNVSAPFKSGIATNAGGAWHIAAATGLPERFITSVAIDSTDATGKTIYVTLGGYSRRWVPPGTLQDTGTDAGVGHLFKSTDGGETFVDISGNLPDVPATWVTPRGASQLIVGTDIGVFANALEGGTTFAPLHGLPVVPISTMNLKPDDPNLLVAATYGRGVWTYRFTQTIPGGGGGGGGGVETPGTPLGEPLAGPYGFELGDEGWTTTQSGNPLHAWKRAAPGHNSGSSFQVTPYFDESTATLKSPAVEQPGGWTFVDFRNRRDTEPGFDFLTVEWSVDGTNWRAAKWIWDTQTGTWSDQLAFDAQNADYPAFALEKVAFKAPAGPLQIRFRFSADQLISAPLYTGVHVDDVSIGR
ncbi:MAG TPA: hypothetical protein VG144_04110 [Gaiellaceae bacterium]|nr:hypothetical protein [Gaiellaceae bacterium]